ncbi:nucleoside 2-deoxyribosyltransferase [Desulfovibrio desulfuricans]|uniref:nucleoside 2-deoxyribosyltransferase n=1 Tax=Desulfovibrio desulfuricans TaxID=876 RepID=UPI00398449E6
MHTIYQAGPLFTEAEQAWHKALSARLRDAGHHVIWPGDLLTDEQIQNAGANASALIFDTCRLGIERSTCVVALLDGTQVDDGTAWEIGYAYAKGLPIYGIRTDFRHAGETRHSTVNSMIEGCLSGLVRRVEELVVLR